MYWYVPLVDTEDSTWSTRLFMCMNILHISFHFLSIHSGEWIYSTKWYCFHILFWSRCYFLLTMPIIAPRQPMIENPINRLVLFVNYDYTFFGTEELLLLTENSFKPLLTTKIRSILRVICCQYLRLIVERHLQFSSCGLEKCHGFGKGLLNNFGFCASVS